MLSEQGTKICAICPHANDCRKNDACLDGVNARYLANHPNQFPRLMTPAQANSTMAALRAGRTVRRFTNGGKVGELIVSLTKFKNHCAAYSEWGTEALRLRAANAKAADSLKGSTKRSRTHCGRGHEFAVHGLAYKNHVNGRRYRYCKLCNTINGRQGSKQQTPAAGMAQDHRCVRAARRMRLGSGNSRMLRPRFRLPAVGGFRRGTRERWISIAGRYR
jgi:hypothetical protein